MPISAPSPSEMLDQVRRDARPLRGVADVAAVLEHIGDAHTVLLGEASHGTQEFYAMRAEITKRLIVERGFDAVAVESDWPDALRVNRYVKGDAGIADADGALGGYERFPRWMWRNEDVRDFVQWLRAHNDRVGAAQRQVGFYGLDLYSLRASMRAVVDYLEQQDPQAAREARQRYGCFDHYGDDPQRYGYAARFGLGTDCENAVVLQLQALLLRTAEGLGQDPDSLFHAQQNARVVRNAEQYYRAMFRGRDDSWNLRDTHMAQTLYELRVHLEGRLRRPPRIVVWAHNSHLGDARATEPGEQGQLNLGQLVRERHADPGATYLLGFTTHSGSVAAADDWDEPVQRKAVRPSLPGSVERLLHDSGLPMLFLPLGPGVLEQRLLERAIGVVYRPESERWSHYFHVSLARQFDGVVHIDETHAVVPLDPPGEGVSREEPETYPSGI